MIKMVFYSLLLTALAMGFIVTKSDGLRRAAQTGEMAYLTQTTPISLASLTGSGSHTSGYGATTPWYVKYDPRQLWRDRPQRAELNVKTGRVPVGNETRQDTLAAQVAAQGLNSDVVTVVKLD
ncbi:hypothetical protein [Celeribacter naphthalenivorans]|uniref:hypothetical protein n=1 Tax=Celeribacter naphthalenivorans TaxID=1614694 RepID=UPI001CFBC725|nr:hypothetical protein [Celeribacter naphthalenivorans]